jgi:uncharacterized protein
MSENEIKYGKIGWIDLTVPDADKIRDFYSKVAGWEPTPVNMGEYDDYVMTPPKGEAAAGICHARGQNEGIPPYWMIYINVKDIQKSISDCKELGGTVVKDIKEMGTYGKYAVIKDPAGAFTALFEPAV